MQFDLPLNFVQKVHKNYELPIAVAVVMSGQYEDNLDNADDIIYTGEGGNDLLGNKLQCQDQVLVRGNLALKVGDMKIMFFFLFKNITLYIF